MKGPLGEAFWRLEAELLAPSRGLKGLRGAQGSLVIAVEGALAEGPLKPEEERLVREGKP